MPILFDDSTFTFALDAGAFSARGGTLRLTIDGGDFDLSAQGGSMLGLDVQVDADEDGAMRMVVRNGGDAARRVSVMTIRFPPGAFVGELEARAHRQLVHAATFDRLVGVKPLHAPTAWCEVNPDSDMMTVYARDDGAALLIGALPPFGDAFTILRRVHDERHMQGAFGIDIVFDLRCEIPPGESRATSPVIALHGDDGAALMANYASMMSRRRGRANKPNATGWNSWDYYAGAVRRCDMDQNIAACREQFGDRVRYMVIDEGYEAQWGVWDAGWKFTEGLRDYCDHVRAAGYEPGVWTAPLMMNLYTPLFREHGDWFVSDATDNVLLEQMSYGTMAQLDITRNDVQQHLREVFARLRDDGFTYFKCDFMQHLLKADGFARRDVGRAELIRIAVRVIREAIGDDAYLLLAGSPFESVVEYADACRTTGDIAPFAGNICQNIRAMVMRWWMQGAIGNGDPDFAIVRCGDTADDTQHTRRMPIVPMTRGVRWKDGPHMTLDEAKTLLLAVHLTGGDVIFGDAMAKLNATGIGLLNRLLPPLSKPAIPINLFAPRGTETPVMLAETDHGRLLGCFNLTEEPVTHRLDHRRVGAVSSATDFWTGQPVTLNDPPTVTLAPRCAAGLVLK